MSATYTPFGLKPAYDESGSGAIRSDQFTVASAYASNIFIGSPVRLMTGGVLELCPAGVVVGTNDILGTFEGVQFQRTDGSYHNGYWPAGSTYLASTCRAFVSFANTSQVFEIQSAGTLTQAALGKGYPITANASANGNTATGQSTVGMAFGSPVTAPAPGQCLVVGLAPREDNAWGDAYPVLLVKVGLAQFAPAIPSTYS